MTSPTGNTLALARTSGRASSTASPATPEQAQTHHTHTALHTEADSQAWRGQLTVPILAVRDWEISQHPRCPVEFKFAARDAWPTLYQGRLEFRPRYSAPRKFSTLRRPKCRRQRGSVRELRAPVWPGKLSKPARRQWPTLNVPAKVSWPGLTRAASFSLTRIKRRA